jgi:RimJ/RimL family protein N-acetyltransferase
MHVLDTTRLHLRHFTEQDADWVLRLLNEPSFIDNIGDRGVRDPAAAEAFLLKGPMAAYTRDGFSLFAVEEATTHTCIGMCGLLKREFTGEVDVGYAFFPEYSGLGYATEAAAAVIAWGRATKGLVRLDRAGDVLAGHLAFLRQRGDGGMRDVVAVHLEEAAQVGAVSLRPKPSVPSTV